VLESAALECAGRVIEAGQRRFRSWLAATMHDQLLDAAR
jgi:hypothetical protein